MALIEVDREWTAATVPDQPPRGGLGYAVALSLLLALQLGGAAPPARPLTPLATIADSGRDVYEIVGDTLYLAEPVPDDRSLVTAYALPGAQKRWSTMLPVPIGVLDPTVADGVLLGQAYRGPAGFAQVVAMDAGTGRILWRQEGQINWVRGHGQLLVEPGPGATLIRDLDLRTGAVLWSRSEWRGSAEVAASPPAAAGDRVVVQVPDGGLAVLDATTGRTLARGPVPPGIGLYVIGDEVLVPLRVAGTDVLAGYDLGTLERRWLVTLPGPATFIADCGHLLCVTCIGMLTVLRAADGTRAWPASSWNSASPAGRYLVADGPTPAVLDTGTGASRLSLAGWSVLGTPDGTRVLVRAGSPSYAGLLVFDGSAPALRPLGPLDPVRPTTCQAASGYLACRLLAGQLSIWRYVTGAAGRSG